MSLSSYLISLETGAPFVAIPAFVSLRTFIRYSFEQGLIRRQPSPGELFAAETREVYVIGLGYRTGLTGPG